ncbi:sulfatase-like hydrolase/transferase [Haladaptatus cibarius]|uniref:sulfatase-like hydrolase/transferase n=1 Tax=Haladaptatus cibarius TaxID=453847 RepID=UPI000679830F|nr:sulfatase-like hydrolase/transferase [Haladaptatus cibarius]
MPPAERETETSTPRNVVVVCLDTVRADFFSQYAKRLQRLADVSFTQCRVVSSWTVPSHASMFTGKLPSEHGVHTHNRRFDSIPREETFLADLDHATFGVSANAFVSSTYGFDSWVDELSEIEPKHRYPEATSLNEVGKETDATGVKKYTEYLQQAVKHDHPVLSLKNTAFGYLHAMTKTGPISKQVDDGGSAVVRTAKQHIDSIDEPYFGFCNLMDAHTPLHPCKWFDSSLNDVPDSWTSSQYDVWELMDESERHDEYWHLREQVYGATIEYLDRILAEFVHDVLDSGGRETTIVVTADHGENHGTEADDFLANHKSSLSEGLLHVPLLLINPPEGYDKEEDGYVSQLDFGDLVVGLANGETPDVFRDRFPAELVGMSAGPEPPENREYWDRMIRCVYDGTKKTVWDSLGTRTEYELDPDRLSWQKRVETGEGTPEVEPDFFDTPVAEAKATAAADKNDGTKIDSATESRLEELGYL